MEAKRALRRRMLAARRGLSPHDLAAAEEASARLVLDLPEVRRATRVAAYVSVGREPGTTRLREELRGRGVTVLLPVLLLDDDLDWAEDDGRLVTAGRGLLEPHGPRLGVGAVAGVDLVLLPGLAVSRDGMRLGRGGGSYDRALARVAARFRLPAGARSSTDALPHSDEQGERSPYRHDPEIPLVVLLHRGEVLDSVPTEPHDHPVHAAVTPDEVLRF